MSPTNFKKIDGYENYEINSLGIVRNAKTNKFMKISMNKDGYMKTRLCNRGKAKNALIHRLLGIAFIPNLGNKSQINHIDSNRSNNKLENLEWCTPKENMEHCKKQGRLRKQDGELNTSSKLSKEEIQEIRSLLWERKISQMLIAKKYDVTQSSISRIGAKKTWKQA